MSVLDTLRETIGLIQKADNIPLYKHMLALQEQVHALVDENRTLKERLAIREKVEFRKNAYWMGEDGPFCTKCLDADGKLVRLHSQQGFKPQCPSCGTVAADPDAPPPKPIRRTGPSGYLRRGGY